MRSLRFFSSFAMVLAALAFGISFAQAQSEDDDSLNIAAPSAEASASDEPTSGREPLPLESDRYGKTWAIVVGCDYKNRGDAAPFLKPLETAENDAREFAQTLVDIYGYQAAPTPEKEQTLFLLLGADATEAAINDALVHLKTAKENDSVLFYFAGHGVRFSGSALHDRGAIFPSDVVFSADGQPVQHRLRLHSDLLAAVHESKARHRLIILDSCHSGEIFNASAQPRRDADLDTSAETVGRRCLQVIASCGDLEVASDGSGSHSPFTRALIDALKSPPRAEWVTTNELFYFMRPRLKPLRQTPDCRNFQLHGDRDSNDSDGEFRFYVACSEAELSRHRGQAHDPVLLQATVAGEHGRWWFETMPWFIPAFRAEILRERDAVRGDARWVTRDELRNMATRLLDKRRAHLNDPRRRHFELLWEMDRRGQDLRNTLTLIRDDLTKLVEEPARAAQPRSEGTSGVALSEAEPTPRRDYTAENLHFLAVVKHQLRDRDAEAAYRRAIKAYNERSSDRPGDSSQVLGDHLKALCLADFGEYLCKVALDPREGARRFREADEELAGAGPAPFRVYIKCREADCWLELNRWADADAALEIATDSARVFDLHEPQSLSAYAFSRCGWARMSQWKIQEARSWFVRSNEILGGMMDEGGAARWSPTARPNAIVSLPPNRPNDQNEHVAAMETSGDDAIDRGIGSTRPTPLRADVFAVPEFVRRSKDFDAQTLYFHNLHGLAMTLRFSDPRADGTTAAIEYRGLAREIEAALSQVQARQAGVQEDAEAGLIERYVNTLERLGDCSLLGNPALRDPDEAADDFRRAEARAHLLRTRREDRRAKLLYKRAIALSLPSAGRDVELAESLRAAADALVGKTLVPAPSANTAASSSIAGTAPSAASAAGGAGPAPAPVATFTQITSAARATAELATLSRLTPHLVALLKCTSFPEINRAAQSKAAAELRQAIEEHRRELGAKIHRDQLELCLLAAHVLLEYGGETDRLLLRCDADLLTDFCRSNLSPYGDEPSDRDADERDAAESSESLAYLRPFYDAVFRSRLRVDSKQVHELLELHWEATRGTCYQKPKQPRPILAVYILDDRCHMLLDLPRAGGVYAALPNRAADLRKTDHFAPLDAPPEITRALQRWRLEQADVGTETIAIECRWEDPLHQVSARNSAVVETSSSTGSHGGKPATGGRVPRRRFPFQLPEGFCEPEDLAPGSRTAARP